MKEKDHEERETKTPCRENMDEILIPPPLSRCLYRLSWAPTPLLWKKDLKKGSPTCPLAHQIAQASTIPDLRASKKGYAQLLYPLYYSHPERGFLGLLNAKQRHPRNKPDSDEPADYDLFACGFLRLPCDPGCSRSLAMHTWPRHPRHILALNCGRCDLLSEQGFQETWII
jgi:hypothetical protein